VVKKAPTGSKNDRGNGWPDHVRADVSVDGYFKRMDTVERILAEKAGLLKAEVRAALTSSDPATKEKGAKWLRSELQRLRDLQKSGSHPARRGTTLSLLEISDAALTMLEAIKCIDDELLSLLQELLNLDRHRRSIAANLEAFDRAANSEALQTLQGKAPGVRALARENSISVSTASEWKRSAEYKAKVEFYIKCWTDRVGDYAEMVESKFPGMAHGHAFRIAMMADHLLGQVRAQLSDEQVRRDPQVLKAIGLLFQHIRSNIKEPPISLHFLPDEDFSKMSPEDVQRQEAVVLEQLAKMIGDPKDKVGRLKSGVRPVST
jgi:hypothetical protein